MSTRRLPVTYDPQNFKLYAPREVSGFSEVTDIPTLRSEAGDTVHAVSIDDQGDYIRLNNIDTTITLENTGFHEGALAARACFKNARPNEIYKFQFTTSSKEIQERLGIKTK